MENLAQLFNNVMVCTDFSVNSDFAFNYAIEVCRRSEGSSLHLLHVIPEADAQFWKTYIYEYDGDVDLKAKADIDQKVEEYKRRIPDGIEFSVAIRVGKDHQQILNYAEEIDADLIVLGRRSKNNFQKAFMGDITEKVCRSANCAVLVMPLSYQEKRSGSSC